jgi:beta,beta-carotene 9',10'-dioxygenase
VAERLVVLAESPFVVTPAAIPLAGRPFIANYRWRPERGTRFRAVDITTGATQSTWHGPAFFAFHHVNAYERDGDIILDVCAYDNADIIGAKKTSSTRSRR